MTSGSTSLGSYTMMTVINLGSETQGPLDPLLLKLGVYLLDLGILTKIFQNRFCCYFYFQNTARFSIFLLLDQDNIGLNRVKDKKQLTHQQNFLLALIEG